MVTSRGDDPELPVHVQPGRGEDATWLQYAVTAPPPEAARDAHAALRALAHRHLTDGRVDSFFFMRKEPGLRLRFRLTSTDAPGADLLDADITRWTGAHGARGGRRGVYEPESRLFGGEPSMPHVHAIFTVDSLAWLDHAATPEPTTGRVARSLELLAATFRGLGVEGLEDLGVWEAVVGEWGRSLDPRSVATDELTQASADVVAFWDSVHGTAPADPYGQLLTTTATAWRTTVLQGPTATIGVRRAAARLVVFHWNRGNLPPLEQALVANALAARADEVRDA